MTTNYKSYRRSLSSVIENHVPSDIIEKNNSKKSWNYGYNKEFDMVVISKDGTIGDIININDLLIALPSKPKKIRFEERQDKDQKWARYKVPEELQYFDKIYGSDENISLALKQVFDRHHSKIIEDRKRIKYGDWFMNDGNAVYVTGYAYFFYQHYKLTENESYPDFRITQNEYFYWLEACFADYRCLGSLLLKSRRSAFTTTGSSIILCDAVRTKNGFFPLMSKNDKDVSELFEKHVVEPFLQLPKHLQPQRVGEVKPKKEMFFSSPKKKITTNNKVNTTDNGLETKIKTYPTTPNAYDGQRVKSKSLNDEIGKLSFSVVKWWIQAHRRCHTVGSEVVGKAICGSTANPPAEGGKEYRDFYEASKLNTRGSNGLTKTGLYAIFIPADYAYMGKFDEWGYPIYENPLQPIKNELGTLVTQGSKEYLDDIEFQYRDNINELNFQKRNDPRTESDCFLDEKAQTMFGTEGVVNLKNFLLEYRKTDEYKSKVTRFNLRWKDGIQDGEVERVDHPLGRWIGCWQPPKEKLNKVIVRDGVFYPANTDLGVLGCDPYATSKAKFGGSKLGVKGITKDNVYSLKEDDRNLMFVSYNHRPDTIQQAEEDVILTLKYFSMPILVENNRKEMVVKLKERGYRGFVLNNPLRKRSEMTDTELIFGGFNSSANNMEAQYQVLENYIDKNIPREPNENNIKVPYLDVIEEIETYRHEDRQKKDGTVAWIYAAIAAERTQLKYKPEKESQNQNINFRQIFAN